MCYMHKCYFQQNLQFVCLDTRVLTTHAFFLQSLPTLIEKRNENGRIAGNIFLKRTRHKQICSIHCMTCEKISYVDSMHLPSTC